jgi:hypothetical protein
MASTKYTLVYAAYQSMIYALALTSIPALPDNDIQ